MHTYKYIHTYMYIYIYIDIILSLCIFTYMHMIYAAYVYKPWWDGLKDILISIL